MTLDVAITDLLTELIEELDDNNTLGFALGGSYARGEATTYSDIDFSRFVKQPITGYARHYYLYRRNFVVEVANIPIEPAWQDLTKPPQAIWFVPALRQLHILQDKNGSLRKLQQAALDFEWTPLQAEANNYASYLLHERVETVIKLIGKLKDTKRIELELQKPTTLLIDILTHLIAVQRGVLVKTGNTYYNQIQEAVGINSVWSKQLLLATGILPDGSSNNWSQRAIAGLRLYLETAHLIQPVIRTQDREVINYTVALIGQELNLLSI